MFPLLLAFGFDVVCAVLYYSRPRLAALAWAGAVGLNGVALGWWSGLATLLARHLS